MEAEEEEGGMRARLLVGTRSREAEAQAGRPGAGAGGLGEVPHAAFSCSSVTYLGRERPKEGTLEVNQTETPERGHAQGGRGITEQKQLLGPEAWCRQLSRHRACPPHLLPFLSLSQTLPPIPPIKGQP